MRLFTRTVHLNGPPAEVAAFAVEMRDLVSTATGVDIGLWNVQFGAPVGTMVYSARVEGLTQLETITATLMATPKYHELLTKGMAYAGAPAEDALGEPIHGGDGDAPPVGTVVTSTRAVMAGGAYSEAIAWSVDMAIHSEKVTGYPVGLFADTFGVFGTVAWISGAPSVAEVEAGASKLNADPSYLEKLSAVGDLFVPSSGVRSLATRIA